MCIYIIWKKKTREHQKIWIVFFLFFGLLLLPDSAAIVIPSKLEIHECVIVWIDISMRLCQQRVLHDVPRPAHPIGSFFYIFSVSSPERWIDLTYFETDDWPCAAVVFVVSASTSRGERTYMAAAAHTSFFSAGCCCFSCCMYKISLSSWRRRSRRSKTKG